MLREEDYCDYETSRALADLGISHCGLHFYEKGYGMTLHHNYMQHLTVRTAKALDRVLAIPLYSAQKWLREEKGIQIEVPISFMDDGVWKFSFRLQTRDFYDRAIGEWDSYEKALLQGIKQAINILREGKK